MFLVLLTLSHPKFAFRLDWIMDYSYLVLLCLEESFYLDFFVNSTLATFSIVSSFLQVKRTTSLKFELIPVGTVELLAI